MVYIQISAHLGIQAHNAGLFISRGRGIHTERTLETSELIFVRQGVLSMHENDEPYTLHAGQTLLLRPGYRHGGTASYSDDLRFYWLHFTITEEPHVSVFDVPQTATLSRPDHMTALFRMFLENQEAEDKSAQASNLLLMLMLEEVAHFSNPQQNHATASQFGLVDRVCTHITLNLDHTLSTASIAQVLDVNPDYLGRTFHAVKGKTITDTIHAMRVRKAKGLLMETNHTIEHISRTCGFESPNYFRRIFLRLEGMSPAKYRQLYCRVHTNTE